MDSLLIFTQIMLINILLSGDNAIVIAMASQHLPPRQRQRAIWWGAGAAVGLRCVLTLVAVTLLQVPYLQAAGAVLLFMIAVKLLLDSGSGESGHAVRKSDTLVMAVWTIVAADFVMSLDNVLAIAAVAEGDPVLIILGIVLSIPLIIWGSQLIGSMLARMPQLVYLGAGLLGFAGGKMLVHDRGLQEVLFHGSRTAAEAVPLLSVPLVIVLYLLCRRA
ncbi:TerC family protein [Paenibacillus tarimensis]|uniref:TerC family protein n=1 Tax=Paenibacillus tarimensis TaxID=416012 RepID=UPI001F32665B|nr:TerC family protein [Paenibacillus tarimensis]MCF2942087.1 TerC family protein [Paenibacillus tarimensis]